MRTNRQLTTSSTRNGETMSLRTLTRGFLPLFTAAALAATLGASGAAYAEKDGDNVVVNAFTGRLEAKVPIGAPTFRGLINELVLSYGSSLSNEAFGVGWGFGGVSTIERVSTLHGSPRYDATDVYLLDGSELIPSCTKFGGQYCPRIETYARIAYQSGTDTWTVATRDGKTATYGYRFAPGATTMRWYLSKLVDTAGNEVRYEYYTDTGVACGDVYLDRLVYNGVTVALHRELRPDVLQSANGTCLTTTRYRVNSIDVCVGTPGAEAPCATNGAVDPKRARAYQLTYTASAATSRSLLTSVRQYGADATLASTGAVTGGTSLPAMTITYRAEGTGAVGPTPLSSPFVESSAENKTKRLFADVNGDGRVDYTRAFTSKVRVRLGNGDGTFGPAIDTPFETNSTTWRDYRDLTDINGDGKADYVVTSSSMIYVKLAVGDGFFGPVIETAHPDVSTGWRDYRDYADVNGDGKPDYVRTTSTDIRVRLGLGDGHFGPVITTTFPATSDGWKTKRDFVDLDGDGRIDYVRAGTDRIYARLSNGDGTFGPVIETMHSAAADGWRDYRDWIDVNGDGRIDYVRTSSSRLYVRLSLGNGSFAPALETLFGTTEDGWRDYRSFADINGDGRIDYTRTRSNKVIVKLSTGDGTFGPAVETAFPTTESGWYTYRSFVDVDGDGNVDYTRTTDTDIKVLRASGYAPNFLATVNSGLGGSTSVEYLPSSQWHNSYLPNGMILQTVAAVSIDDGSGGPESVATTNYAYEGALWIDDDPAVAGSDREFRGFRRATTTLAATGAYAETYYWQRAGAIAKPEVIYKRGADGAIMSFEKFAFTENTTAPYESLVTELWAFECNGDAVMDGDGEYVSGCRRVLTTYAWDQYANMVAEYQYGDYDLSGDERTVVRGFAPNAGAYIVGLPAWENIYTGIGTSGQLMSRVKYYYDGAGSEATPPVKGMLTAKLEWLDRTGGYVANTFAYDTAGNQTAMTDPLGNLHTKTFDPVYNQYVTAITNPLGQATVTEYDYVLGRVTAKLDPDGNATRHYYDKLGRVTLSTNPGGGNLKHEYYDYGNPSQQRVRQLHLLPGGSWAWDDTYLDGLGRPYKKVSQTGVTEETIYGASGKVWKQSFPYAAGETVYWTITTYDDLGRELTKEHPDGSSQSNFYGDGYVTATDSLGRQSTVWFDAYGRKARIRQTLGGQSHDTIFEHDVLGRRVRAIDAFGNQTAASYDSLSRMLQKSDPDRGLWTYEYNDAGQLVAETDAAGRRTELAIDTLGRVTRRIYPDGSFDWYVFDEAGHGASKGRLTTSGSRDGVVTAASYDAMGRRTAFTQTIRGQSQTISHSYDLAGRVATVTYPDNEVVTFTYGASGTALGRLVGVSGTAAGTVVSNVTYTARGQTATLTYGNGVTTTFTYDAPTGRNTQIRTTQSGGTALATFNYGYDTGGRVTSMTSPELGLTHWSYGYDDLGHLTTATNTADSSKSQTFSYDAVGRMLTNSKRPNYRYDALHPHAVLAAGADTYAYDANGNMVSGAGRVYQYDDARRPVALTSAGTTTRFGYDAQGVRVVKQRGTTTTVYTGGIYESSGVGAGCAATKYYFAGSLRVARKDTLGMTFFHSDHLGSTRMLTNAAGQEVQRYEYAPFGRVLLTSGSRTDVHQYAGQTLEDDAGLMFFNSRYYDADLGRFLQADPLTPDPDNPLSFDPYAYAYNNPINFVDPTGHAPVLAAVGIISAAAAAGTVGTIINIACIVIGTALTFTNNPILQTIGMILSGMGSAGLAYGGMGAAGQILGVGQTSVAGLVALAQSPISPLDPTVKKAIGWAWTIYGGVKSILRTADNGFFALSDKFRAAHPFLTGLNDLGKGSILRATIALAVKEALFTVAAGYIAYVVSGASTGVRFAFAFLSRCLLAYSWSQPGPLSMLGATYDMAYTLKYPDGRVIDLSGGSGGEKFTFYYHSGYESPLGFGRQHIRVGDPEGGYWEIGDTGAGKFGPGIGWGSWISTQKITVILNPTQAAIFRGALAEGAKGKGGYVIFSRDSYTYISESLLKATGKSAADLHINPGLFHF
jgi:RHS repeat-associated protein